MQRTSDEIKKGLECCAASYVDCHKECPYKPDCDGSQLLKDALALIQQLEANVSKTEKVIAELSGKIGQLESQNRCFKEIKESCEKRMIDLAQRMPRWISLEERLPENMDDVLVWVGGLVEIGCYDESNECWELYTYVGDGSVTHWMPLPLPPSSPFGEATSLTSLSQT